MQSTNLFKTKLFKISAVSAALVLAGCGGDIELSSNVDNSVGDTNITNPAPTNQTLALICRASHLLHYQQK